jgi:hypothetical protein
LGQNGWLIFIWGICLASSKFGNRKHPVRGKIVFHKGVDYATKFGTTTGFLYLFIFCFSKFPNFELKET